MKLRSLLLVGCMLVVPALAMFSHLIPAEFRAAARRGFAAATSSWLGTPAEAGTLPCPPTTPVASSQSTDTLSPVAGVAPTARAVPPSTANLSAAATGLPPAAAGAPMPAAGSPSPTGTPPAGTAVPPPPPMVAQLADRTRQVRDQQAREQQGIEARLTALGAVSFDCQPLPGADGLYSSSCRVPVDASGQLQRVFQASGQDAVSASAALLEQVIAWRQRLATPPAAAAGGMVGGAVAPPNERPR